MATTSWHPSFAGYSYMKFLDFPPPSHGVPWPWPWPRRSNCDSVDRRPFAWWRIARSTARSTHQKQPVDIGSSFSKFQQVSHVLQDMFCKKWLTTLRSVKQRPLVSSMKWGIEGRKTMENWSCTTQIMSSHFTSPLRSTVTAWDHKSTSIDPSIQQSWGSTPGIQHVAVPAANVPHFRHQHELQLNGIKRPKITRPLGHWINWIAVFEHEANRFRFSVPKIFGDADSDAPWHFSESVLRKPCILGSGGAVFLGNPRHEWSYSRANHL
jgi:hypothetical protein